MARPVKEGMDYFPHDTDAMNDEKVETLMMLYGTKGYAFYFILLERIYRQPNFELDVSDAETRQILSRKITITPQEFETILKSSIKHKCFNKEMYEEYGILTSNGIKKRTTAVVDKREKMRKAYKPIVSEAETPQKPSSNTAESTQSKVKKSKVKESNIYSEKFELFWSEYPEGGYQSSKPQAFKNYNSLIKKGVVAEDIIQSAKNYKTDCTVTGKTDYFYKSSNFVGKDQYYQSYLPDIWIPAKQSRNKNKQEERKELPEY